MSVSRGSLCVEVTRIEEQYETEQLVELDPETFLQMSAAWTTSEVVGESRIIVKGDVDLRGHPLRGKILCLPAAAITGNLYVDQTCVLRICKCRVSGDVNLNGSLIEQFTPAPDLAGSVSGIVWAKDCSHLGKISGSFRKDVHLDRSSIESLHSDFTCSGNLSVEGCSRLRELDCHAWSILADGSSLEKFGPNTTADNISAEGCANLEVVTPITGLRWAKFDGSGVREVHRGFRCAGPAYFKRCRRLTALSGHAMTFEVSMSPLESVSGLRANEVIFTDCVRLPDSMAGLHSKTLVFARCGIEELPRDLTNGASLRLGSCPNFSRLPSLWRGDLSLAELPALLSTPSDFRCQGSLDVAECTNLFKISGVVGGELQIMCGTESLQSLDSDLEVRGDLRLAGDSAVTFLNCKVSGGVAAKGSQVSETGASFRVGGWGDFSDCRKVSVFRGLFGGTVDLSSSTVTHLGADFECEGDLLINNTSHLISLNCTVRGTTVASDSSLARTGPAFLCGGELWARGCRHIISLSGEVSGNVQIDDTARSNLFKAGRYQLREPLGPIVPTFRRSYIPPPPSPLPAPRSRTYPTPSFAPSQSKA